VTKQSGAFPQEATASQPACRDDRGDNPVLMTMEPVLEALD
jgi:hypothetical protein